MGKKMKRQFMKKQSRFINIGKDTEFHKPEHKVKNTIKYHFTPVISIKLLQAIVLSYQVYALLVEYRLA